MMPGAYYNEPDPMAAAWLRALIAQGDVAPGDVDERDIREVPATDLQGYTQVHLFAGIGVWSYALRQAGWPDSVPVMTGSPPCQPFSSAGLGHGRRDPRHLWPWMRDHIDALAPETVFMEQVSSKDGLAWFDEVAFDATAMGYDSTVFDVPAAAIGAPHIRQRLYIRLDRGPRSSECVKDALTRAFDRPATPGNVAYRMAWKNRSTPSGLRVRALRATGYRQGGPTILDAIAPHGRATTTARDGSRGSLPPRVHDTGVPLDQMAALSGYPTPAQRDWKDTPGMAVRGVNPDRSTRARLDMTPRVAALAAWGTPLANHANGDPESFLDRKRRSVERGSKMEVSITDLNMQAQAWASGSYRVVFDGTVLPSHPATSDLGSLNPAHSRWLMGLPYTWDEAAFKAFGGGSPNGPLCEPPGWDSDWLFCRDGKWRPVAPWSFPLALSTPGRKDRLRGYGNAIVGPLAGAFVEATGGPNA